MRSLGEAAREGALRLEKAIDDDDDIADVFEDVLQKSGAGLVKVDRLLLTTRQAAVDLRDVDADKRGEIDDILDQVKRALSANRLVKKAFEKLIEDAGISS
ncbi:hypothetical protein ElyMa_006882000 [Elysia marginata]|uniref:CARD domain-containing protein n=1 Tax=Elysia marginata TaxID=1093978 RepID=A0AAV4JCK4_9GAST|nr:hypothetical protein ElyMa_006882000 [Elysia marginata]